MPQQPNPLHLPTRRPKKPKTGRSLADPRQKRAPVPTRQERIRWGALPSPLDPCFVPWAKENQELADLCEGRLVSLLTDSPEFQSTIGPELQAITAGKQAGRGPRLAWTALDKEAVRLFMVASGQPTIRDALNVLAGWDHREGRLALGFDHVRPRTGGSRKDGSTVYLENRLPSRSTITHHLSVDLKLGEALKLYRELFYELARTTVALPEMEHACRLQGLDGTDQPIVRAAPIYPAGSHNNPDRQPVNQGRITAPNAGYRGRDKTNPNKLPVHGFHGVVQSTDNWLPLSVVVDKFGVGRGESNLGERALLAYAEEILPHHPNPNLVRVLTADGAFNSARVRGASHRAHLLLNAHFVSHKGNNEQEVRNHDDVRYPLDPVDPVQRGKYRNWALNGHREPVCACGATTIHTQVGTKPNGAPASRVIGRCQPCGSVSLTMGQWRDVQNPSKYQRVNFVNRERADLSVGNVLTYHDARSQVLGRLRFYHQEGLFGAIVRRFKYLVARDFRDPDEFELGLLIIFCFAHVLTHEFFRRKREGSA